jgi:hypothetical protein
MQGNTNLTHEIIRRRTQRCELIPNSTRAKIARADADTFIGLPSTSHIRGYYPD